MPQLQRTRIIPLAGVGRFVYSAPPIIAGLQADYAAEAGLYQDAAMTIPAAAPGDPVGGWQDQSGNARHVTQATAGARPTYRASQVNGWPTLEFDGTDDRLFNAIAISAYIDAAAYSTFIVFAADAINTNAVNTYDNDTLIADQAGPYFGVHLKSAPTAHAYNWDGSDDNASVAITLATYAVLHTRHDTGAIKASVNGGAEASTASGNTQVLTNVFGIGRGANVAFFDGHIARILIYNAALSAPNVASVIAYLKTRYGIA